MVVARSRNGAGGGARVMDSLRDALEFWEARGHVTERTRDTWMDYLAAVEAADAHENGRMPGHDDMVYLRADQLRAVQARSAFELILWSATLHDDRAAGSVVETAERFVQEAGNREDLSCLERIDLAVVATRLGIWAAVAGWIRDVPDEGGSPTSASDVRHP